MKIKDFPPNEKIQIFLNFTDSKINVVLVPIFSLFLTNEED